MDQYKDIDDSSVNRKKLLLVPLITLLICVISLTAVAFAYYHASELEIEKNGLDGKYYEIDYTNSNGVQIETALDILDFSAYTDITVDTDAGTRTFDAYLNGETFERTFYVTLNTDMGDDRNFTISATADFGSVISQFLTLTDVAYSSDNTAVKNGDTIGITLTMSITADKDVKTITGITPSGNGIDSISDLADALESICSNTYTVNVNAAPTA